MTLPLWIAEPAPADLDLLLLYLTEALALGAEYRGHRDFAQRVRCSTLTDLFHPLCQRAWHARQKWSLESYRFWALYPRVEADKEMIDLLDTVCFMTPLGDLEDEAEAAALWPDLVATLQGFSRATAS